MKKIKSVICIVMCVLLAGCSVPTGNTSNSTAGNSSQISSADKSTPEPEQTPEPEPVNTFSIGDTITTESLEITINNLEFSYDVLPDDVSGFYTHYEADAGKVYVHLDADVKNLMKQNLKCDKILTIEVDYNDGFKYTGSAVPEDNTTGFTYSNITSIDPLETRGIRFLVNCPDEVAESGNPVIVKVTIDGTTYEASLA